MSDELEPSEHFIRAFCDGGTPVQDCGFCGRTNFDSSGEFMDEGELEELLLKSNREPDKYEAQSNTIGVGNLDGRTFVAGCPCNKVRKYEDFIWNNRHGILRYLEERTQAELQEAEREASNIRKYLSPDWRGMESAPRNATWLEVKLTDSSVTRAHFARDLSGEEQPPFEGWFEKCGSGHFVSCNPIAWRPLQ